MIKFIETVSWQFVALVLVIFGGSIVAYLVTLIRNDHKADERFRRELELERFRSEKANLIEKKTRNTSNENNS